MLSPVMPARIPATRPDVIPLLLDENVDRCLQKALARRSPDLVERAIGALGAPPLQSSDPEILTWCDQNGFMLVTNNRASMPVHLKDRLAAGGHVPGILVLNPKMALQHAVDELLLVASAAKTEDYVDMLLYLPVVR